MDLSYPQAFSVYRVAELAHRPPAGGMGVIEINFEEDVDKDIDMKSVGPGNMDGRVNNIPRN